MNVVDFVFFLAKLYLFLVLFLFTLFSCIVFCVLYILRHGGGKLQVVGLDAEMERWINGTGTCIS